MIEGLRVAPAYFDARHEGKVQKSCQECKRTVNATARQHMGCGYEPAIAGAVPWSPPAWRDRGLRTTVCPGYTTALPATMECFDAYPQWEARTLTEYLGEPPTDAALAAMAALKAGINEHQADSMRRSSTKGGA